MSFSRIVVQRYIKLCEKQRKRKIYFAFRFDCCTFAAKLFEWSKASMINNNTDPTPAPPLHGRGIPVENWR